MKSNLSPDQQEALNKFIDFILKDESNEFVIAGSAGTGKTFLTKYLLEKGFEALSTYRELFDKNLPHYEVHLTSTTNQAASILAANSGFDAKTIHSLLKLVVSNDYQTGEVKLNQKDFDGVYESIIFIDEASMIDDKLYGYIQYCLLQPEFKNKVIYIGDEYQLPPVNNKDCIVFNRVPNIVRLTTIQRQALNNPIISLANSFREAVDTGKFPSIIPDDTHILRLDGSTFKDTINNTFTDPNSMYNSKVLAWTNKRVNEYNKHIRGLHTSSHSFEPDEIVITNKPIKNSIFGGNVVIKTDRPVNIKSITPITFFNLTGSLIKLSPVGEVFIPDKPNEAKKLINQFAKDKVWVKYFGLKDSIGDLRPVYSCTVHKSQGSTYKNTFIDLHDIGRHYEWKELAKLLYVAITRASDRVIFHGSLPKRFGG